MRRYPVSRGVERDLRFKGLDGIWIVSFILGQALLLSLALICILSGLSVLWVVAHLALLAILWTCFCYRMSQRFPHGGLERLMGLHLMPRCLERRCRLDPLMTKEDAAELTPDEETPQELNA